MRYLLVGLGNIGAKRKAVLGDRCVATVDPFNPAADYRSPEDCVEPYDAAILAVPNAVKVGLIGDFLEAGTHVLVEKPLIVHEADVERFRQLSARTGAICYTSYNFQFEPHVVTLKRHLEEQTLGHIYRVRMFYGNGSAPAIKGTWRDDEYGVVADMACHLIDLVGFLFFRRGGPARVWRHSTFGLQGPDHCVVGMTTGSVVLEASWTSWKNRWRIEIVGERGTLEMDGLTKWGRSELVHYLRSEAGGEPTIHDHAVVTGPDPTWALDLQHFEERVARRNSSYDNDLWISRIVTNAVA